MEAQLDLIQGNANSSVVVPLIISPAGGMSLYGVAASNPRLS